MSIEFSTNISALRREKNISQKDAAAALGISQALLSHYEKGIRECNLNFVIKAAEYYDVTTDYILGISESRHGINKLSDFDAIPEDSQIEVKTILRSFLYLAAEAEDSEESQSVFFTDFFSLCLKKYISLFKASERSSDKLYDFALAVLCEKTAKPGKKEISAPPQFLKTVSEHAIKLIQGSLGDII